MLNTLPELIFDSFRKMLWRLEVDGMYGLEASGEPIENVRGSIREALSR